MSVKSSVTSAARSASSPSEARTAPRGQALHHLQLHDDPRETLGQGVVDLAGQPVSLFQDGYLAAVLVKAGVLHGNAHRAADGREQRDLAFGQGAARACGSPEHAHDGLLCAQGRAGHAREALFDRDPQILFSIQALLTKGLARLGHPADQAKTEGQLVEQCGQPGPEPPLRAQLQPGLVRGEQVDPGRVGSGHVHNRVQGIGQHVVQHKRLAGREHDPVQDGQGVHLLL